MLVISSMSHVQRIVWMLIPVSCLLSYLRIRCWWRGLKYRSLLGFFLLQKHLGFLLKSNIFITICISETFRPCYEYFESLEENRALYLFNLGCLPLSRPACIPHVKWLCLSLGGWNVYISLFVFLSMLMVETKDRRLVSTSSGCSCLDSSLPVVFSFFPLLLCLKLEVILWMQAITGMSPEKQLQIWLRTELLKSNDGGFLCGVLNYHFFPIN